MVKCFVCSLLIFLAGDPEGSIAYIHEGAANTGQGRDKTWEWRVCIRKKKMGGGNIARQVSAGESGPARKLLPRSTRIGR